MEKEGQEKTHKSYKDQIFNVQLPSFNDKHKIFLLEMLENRFAKNVLHTKLLYKYDSKNPTNFHEYIDEKQNICLIYETKDGLISGGISLGTLKKKENLKEDSILFSLSNEIFFEPNV